MRTIAGVWEEYRAKVIPPNASEAQFKETEQAFYAGAYSVLEIMLTIGDDDVSMDDGVNKLESMKQECERFAERFKPRKP